MDRDNITRTGARAPGVKRRDRLHGGVLPSLLPDTERDDRPAAGGANDGCQPSDLVGMPGAGLTARTVGKVPSERPALEPYRGKPAVRNLRGGDGDVGIIRSPVRAIVLPDPPTMTPSHVDAAERTRPKR